MIAARMSRATLAKGTETRRWYGFRGLLTVVAAQYTAATMEKGRFMRVSLLAVVAVSFVLALGGTALAQESPTDDTYGGVLGNEVENSGSSTGSVGTVQNESGGPPPAAEGSLPFTGFEVGMIALVGIGLVSLGFAMRRGTRRRPLA
jgi:hypothetical protein